MSDLKEVEVVQGLDKNRLDYKQTKADGSEVYRCPACAEDGHDNKGEHLIIYPDGRFGCVAFPDESGVDHRKRIFALVGSNSVVPYPFKVYPAQRPERRLLLGDILGRLGRGSDNTSPKNIDDDADQKTSCDKSENGVPTVPNDDLDYLK